MLLLYCDAITCHWTKPWTTENVISQDKKPMRIDFPGPSNKTLNSYTALITPLYCKAKCVWSRVLQLKQVSTNK